MLELTHQTSESPNPEKFVVKGRFCSTYYDTSNCEWKPLRVPTHENIFDYIKPDTLYPARIKIEVTPLWCCVVGRKFGVFKVISMLQDNKNCVTCRLFSSILKCIQDIKLDYGDSIHFANVTPPILRNCFLVNRNTS